MAVIEEELGGETFKNGQPVSDGSKCSGRDYFAMVVASIREARAHHSLSLNDKLKAQRQSRQEARKNALAKASRYALKITKLPPEQRGGLAEEVTALARSNWNNWRVLIEVMRTIREAKALSLPGLNEFLGLPVNGRKSRSSVNLK